MNREEATALFERKRLAYLNTFCGDNGKIHLNADLVLQDLKKFCRWNGSAVAINPLSRVADPHMTFYIAGQQDMLKRILGFLGNDPGLITQERDDNESPNVSTTAE